MDVDTCSCFANGPGPKEADGFALKHRDEAVCSAYDDTNPDGKVRNATRSYMRIRGVAEE